MSQRGSVRKRRATWTAYWFVRDMTGKRRQRSKGGFLTRAQAQAHLTDVLSALQTGSWIDPSKLTVGEFLTEQWLPAIQASVRPTTLDSYRRNIACHVLPRLGTLPLQQLGAEHLNALYAALLADGRRAREGGLAPKTVRYIHTIIHKALKDAVRWGKLPRNCAASAEPPKLNATRAREMKIWTAAELRQFLRSVFGTRLEAAWVLAATTGMRRGEVLGLRWEDVDLESGQLAIRQNLVSVAYELRFSAPKTSRSARVVSLDPRTVAALRSHRSRCAEERLSWGEGYEDQGLVFSREDGQPVHPDAFTQAFERYARAAGLPRIRLHDLRHTYATLALRAGVPAKIVSDRLGHSTVAFTQDVYTHAIPAMQDEAAESVARLIFGA